MPKETTTRTQDSTMQQKRDKVKHLMEVPGYKFQEPYKIKRRLSQKLSNTREQCHAHIHNPKIPIKTT